MAWRSIGGGLLAIALLVTGCSGSDEPARRATKATPITRLDVPSVRLARAEFCDQVPEASVRRALGAAPDSDRSWGNGDPVPDGATGDLAHEIGCSWSADDGSAASAWVFARPVTAAFAGTLVRTATRRRGCTTEQTSVFGSPALLQTCAASGAERLRRAGLFGDAWLTCEVTVPGGVPAAERRQRLDDWCATAVATLDVA